MKRTLFVKDLRSKREYVWQCAIEEDATKFLGVKLGHHQWELLEELKEFDKGEAVEFGSDVGVVEDVFRTPFLLRERRLIASQRNPIYRIKIGEGVVYVTSDQLLPKVRVLNAIRDALAEEDVQLVTGFMQRLIERVRDADPTLLTEHSTPLHQKSDRLLEGRRLLTVYESIFEVLGEDVIEEEMGALDVSSRNRLVSRCFSSGVSLPHVTSESGPLGLTTPELRMWESCLGAQWKAEYKEWIEEGFSPSEVQAFVKSSRDPQECTHIRTTLLTLEDFVNA